jgi:hypothetical protein
VATPSIYVITTAFQTSIIIFPLLGDFHPHAEDAGDLDVAFVAVSMSTVAMIFVGFNIEIGWSTKFLCREISRNIYFVFREIICFYFAKFRIAKYYEISRNIAKFL